MDDGNQGQGHLTWVNVGIGLLFLVADAILSLVLKLGVEVSLLTAAARCILQLSVMVRFISLLFLFAVPCINHP
jgi:ABC-type iron transport system FetAB permease component